jgi:DNA polymerase (family 10)
MENLSIARVLGEIADLLEIKGENAFKVRAYRNAADVVADSLARIADLPLAELLQIPGIGKDLAAKLRELAETGTLKYHEQLLTEFPPTIRELLRLQGIGPKTVALLYRELAIASTADLEAAAAAGRLRAIKGMGAKKESLILKAIAEQRQFAGRHLMPEAHEVARALVGWLQQRAPGASMTPVGSLRRGAETCGDLDILVAGADMSLMDAFVRYPQVERVLARGDTKSSVLLWKGVQADLRLVAPESRGAALQYFTGSKAHNIALRDRAIQQGLHLNEYGLFRADGTKVAGEDEPGVYEALGLAWVPPELRECRGEIDAAEERRLPRLIEVTDLKGDLHAHTSATDGRDTIEAMAAAARARGYEYLAITDHSQSLAMANGLNEASALAHAAEVRAIGARIGGITLLAGIECDIRPDGTMDLADECLAQLDFVVASVHSSFLQSEEEMTTRIVRAIENPWVDAIGHLTGRLLLRREPYKVDFERIVAEAARHGVALEINSQIDRLDISDAHARLAMQRGVPIVVSSDAHSARALDVIRWGVVVARRAWLTAEHVLNTRPLGELRSSLRRARTRRAEGDQQAD